MWIYLLLLVVTFILLILFVVNLLKLSYKTVQKVVKNKKLQILLSLIPLCLFAIGFFIDTTNAIIVDLHLIIIIFIIKIIVLISERIFNKRFNEYISLGVGIAVSIIVLCYGYYSAFNVVETNYEIFTSKDINNDNFRVVQVSDSHIGTTMNGKKFSSYMEEINKIEPDIVVITGDFIDDGTSYEDMVDAASGLGKLKTKYGVYFIYGNHDKGYYNRSYKVDDLVRELNNNNVIILEDEVTNVTDKIVLIGRQDAEVTNRVPAQNLTKDIDKNKFLIMLDHQPNDYNNEKESGADLVLSGHTHGGQVIPLGQLGVLLGANDKLYGMEKIDNTTFIVSSGISDWAIKFKTGTISEFVVIEVKTNH